MKNQLFALALFLVTTIGFTQESKDIDSTAIFILDKMSAVIGDLHSVNFHSSSSNDKMDVNKNIIKEHHESDISFSGPDKLHIRIDGSDEDKAYYYDGSHITYYNYNENNYVTLEAPETTLEMIDDMHLHYDFQFPAADFFYPAFTDDLIEDFDSIKYLGKKTFNNEECYHIMANNKKLNVQIWISSHSNLLPKHFVIIYKDNSNMQHEATFSNWNLNPNIPDAKFDFLAPPNSRLISILKK
ncbi:DUF2092 domain-containing protein [Tamlana sp. 2_MG-2023]|uniref:DUF2092 domain-containing protein n=1 Tax=unclassified Tamlana TaxID=2614803 RepID=UPI0026E23FE9|nr:MULTISPECIES: DUF2092 domain-containing protein [unclassified Tamlana]MDO6760441.1 DUF2092 domain-containing protein [Tamlana sp. 2_MG-2023]MDO6789860.1 DUF2092 domain-containing protein [Tamlana sp. 1_MG-2023]